MHWPLEFGPLTFMLPARYSQGQTLTLSLGEAEVLNGYVREQLTKTANRQWDASNLDSVHPHDVGKLAEALRQALTALQVQQRGLPERLAAWNRQRLEQKDLTDTIRRNHPEITNQLTLEGMAIQALGAKRRAIRGQ